MDTNWNGNVRWPDALSMGMGFHGPWIMANGVCSMEMEGVPMTDDQPYKEAIDEAMVVRHLGIAEGDPIKELNTIISWEVGVALDPSVSSAAQALIDEGRTSFATETQAERARRSHEDFMKRKTPFDMKAVVISNGLINLNGEQIPIQVWSFDRKNGRGEFRTATLSPMTGAGRFIP